MELQKYFLGFFVLAFGVLCLLAGRFEHMRRRTFQPTKGMCENVKQGHKVIRPCYQHTFRFVYNDSERVGETRCDYERLELNKKYRILVNPMKPSEVLLEKDITRITRNEVCGWVLASIGILTLLFAALL